jgi:hypothetical protein
VTGETGLLLLRPDEIALGGRNTWWSNCMVSDSNLQDRQDGWWNRLAPPYTPMVLNGLGAAVGLWAIIIPWPYDAAVLSAMMVVAMALILKILAPSLSEPFVYTKSDRWSMAGSLFMVPALAMALRANSDLNLLGWRIEMEWSACIAALLAIPLLIGDAAIRSRPFFILLLLVLTFGYAAGSLAELNSIFDTSQPVVYPTTIWAKHVYSGKAQVYELILTGWGDQPIGSGVKVPYSFFEERRAGERVCIYLRQGWLGFPHYNADSCVS